MRKCLGPCILTAVLIVLLVTVAGCEKERPAPGPTATVALPLGTAAPAFAPAAVSPEVTQVTLPRVENAQPAAPLMPTPAPLAPVTPTPAPPQPLSTAGSTQAGQNSRSDEYFIYTVDPGDTLAAIAEKYDLTTEDIMALNSDVDPDLLDVGQELKIPGSGAAAGGSPSAAAPNTYVIRAGETLYSIAVRFGVSVADLQEINKIGDVDQISVGQELRIPTSASPGGAGSSSTYVVEPGDNLLNIALQYGITIESLQRANDISDPDEVYVGQVLTIP